MRKTPKLFIQCLTEISSRRRCYYRNYQLVEEVRNFVSVVAALREVLGEFEFGLEGARVVQLQQLSQLIKSGNMSN